MKSLGLAIIAIGIIIRGYLPSMALVFDTGWISREQPDGTVFVGREWGDEFLYFGETRDGYRYEIDSSTEYFHYQMKNSSGDIIRSSLKVGIDDPAQQNIPKHLDLSSKEYDKIRGRMRALGYIADENPTGGRAVTRQRTIPTGQWTLDIVLVDFSDVAPREPSVPSQRLVDKIGPPRRPAHKAPVRVVPVVYGE